MSSSYPHLCFGKNCGATKHRFQFWVWDCMFVLPAPTLPPKFDLVWSQNRKKTNKLKSYGNRILFTLYWWIAHIGLPTISDHTPNYGIEKYVKKKKYD